MKSRPVKSKPLPRAERREVAEFIVKYPDLTIVQVAHAFGITRALVYKIIGEHLTVERQYVFKRPTEPTE